MPLARRIGRPGLIGTAARTAVIAGTAQATTNAMAHRQAARQEESAPQAAAAPSAGADLTTQLQQLGRLHASGVLDDAEFAAAKAKLLS